jgi:thiamine biosynthesis lipoprotein
VKPEPVRASRWSGHASWQALGTSVVLRTVDTAGLSSARKAVEAELAAIDCACSRFRADSELSRLNDRCGRPVQVSPLLLDALTLALEAARVTDGDVDPTLGRALELAGYDRDWHSLPTAGEDRAQGARASTPVMTLRALGGWRSISLDTRTRTVRVPHGILLDLGATAKALAADRAATAAHEAGGCGVLVSLGGDIATAGPAPAGGWRIHVTDDHRSDATAPGQTVSIRSGALATSSTTVRRWCHEGRTMHHILDPATGNPANTCWRTVSVAAESCAHANIAATASLVRGRAALDWLAGLELPARLQEQDGSVTTIGDWPAQPSARSNAAVAA